MQAQFKYSDFKNTKTYTARRGKYKLSANDKYYMKQRLSGLVMATIGIIAPFILDGDATISLFVLPLGIFLLLTEEKVMTF